MYLFFAYYRKYINRLIVLYAWINSYTHTGSSYIPFWRNLLILTQTFLKDTTKLLCFFKMISKPIGWMEGKNKSGMALHVYFEHSRSYILWNRILDLRKSKNIIGKPRKFWIIWWWITVPEEIDMALTKALSQKRWNFKSSNLNRNELTENPKTSLESSQHFAVFQVWITFRKS